MTGLTFHEKDGGRTVEVSAQARFCIELAENPTTGYLWSQPEFDHDVIMLESDETIPLAGSGIGGGAVRRFAFVARTAGKAPIRLTHRRPWEGDSAAVARFEITVVVAKEK